MSTEPVEIMAEPPLLMRVERGHPNAEEVAVLTALFAALGGQEDAAPARHRAGWSSRRRTFNPGAVRGSGWGGGL